MCSWRMQLKNIEVYAWCGCFVYVLALPTFLLHILSVHFKTYLSHPLALEANADTNAFFANSVFNSCRTCLTKSPCSIICRPLAENIVKLWIFIGSQKEMVPMITEDEQHREKRRAMTRAYVQWMLENRNSLVFNYDQFSLTLMSLDDNGLYIF